MRSASASLGLVAVAVAVGACATSPPRLPPPHAPSAYSPAPPAPAGPDAPLPAAPPIIRERYGLLTSTLDILSVVPLVMWANEPEKYYLAAPSLIAVPVVHALKGNPEHAVISLAARAGVMGVVHLASEADRETCEGDAFLCFPMRTYLAFTALLVPLIAIDALFARSEHVDESWGRLPTLGVSPTAQGGGLLTLGGTF